MPRSPGGCKLPQWCRRTPGLLHEVTVSLARVGYWYDLEAVRAEVDQDSGEVILDALALAGGGWGGLTTCSVTRSRGCRAARNDGPS
jgi:hypothetical protein